MNNDDYDIRSLFHAHPDDDPRQTHLKVLIDKSLKEVDNSVSLVLEGNLPRENLDMVLMRTYRQIYELREIVPTESVSMTVDDLFLDTEL